MLMSYKLKSNSVVHELALLSDVKTERHFIRDGVIGWDFIKIGHIVICQFSGVGEVGNGTWEIIPSGYRPVVQCSAYYPCMVGATFHGDGIVRFYPSGNVEHQTSTSAFTERYGCACWITAD